MIRVLVAAFIISDVIYQVFGDSSNYNWSVYYNLTHYIFISAVCLNYLHDKLMNAFSVYFLAVVFTIIYQAVFRLPFMYKNSLYIWGYVILFLLFAFSIHKIWKK